MTTTTTDTAAQAAPCPAVAQSATRDTRESLTLEFNDVTQACEVLAALCEHVHRQYTRDQPWHTARAVNRVAIAAAALHYFSEALLDPMVERMYAGGETLDTSPDQRLQQAVAQAQAASHDTRPAPAPQTPRLVKSSSVARLEVLRGEFSDDPEGISFILDFLHVLDKDPKAILDALEHTVAQAPTETTQETPAA